jgi:hypothetical protein
MKTRNAVGTFIPLSREEKVRFLLRLAHELTLVARESYEPGTEALTHPARVRAVNEIQHRILAFLIALVEDDPRRYPDDVLLAIILEDNDRDPEFRNQVWGAFDRACSSLAD